jgi:hypothetical protein
MTWSRLKLAGFWRGGNSLKDCSNLQHAYVPARSESAGDDAGRTVALESALIMGA